MEQFMHFNHPLEIPKSKVITGLAWTADRTPIPQDGIHNDTHPMTWATNGEMYMATGDPNLPILMVCSIRILERGFR
jgi:hypothetical protein